jgi:hypothetical protein
MAGSTGRNAAFYVWIATLVLLLPSRGASVVIMVVLLASPPRISMGPEMGYIAALSYPIAVAIVMLTSAAAVLFSQNERATLRIVAAVDALCIAAAAVLTFVYGV